MTDALADLLLLGGRPVRVPPVARRRPERDWLLIDVDMGAAMALVPQHAEAVEDEGVGTRRRDGAGGRAVTP